MSEEAVAVETAEAPVVDNAGAAQAVLNPDTRTESPFDALFAEGAVEKLPSNVANWVKMQKNGLGVENALSGLQKVASSKGFERPGEDATEEQREAFNAKLRDLQGIPKTVEEYSFEYPEGMTLPDELATKVKEFGIEKGIPPQNIEALLPFQMELQKQSEVMKNEAHIAAQMEMGDKYFGGEGSFDKEAPGLAEYAERQGYDVKNDPAFRNATTYKLLAEMRRMTGEDSGIVKGDTASDMDTITSQLNDLVANKDNPMNLALNNPRDARHAEAKKLYMDLNRKVSESKAKSIRRL